MISVVILYLIVLWSEWLYAFVVVVVVILVLVFHLVVHELCYEYHGRQGHPDQVELK